jgi:hypothetical protein
MIATWLAAPVVAVAAVSTAIETASSPVTMSTTATVAVNRALVYMIAGARYTGTGKLAAVLRSSGGGCTFPEKYGGVERGQGCVANTVHATITLTVAPDKSKITNLATRPTPLPFTGLCGPYGQLTPPGTVIPLTTKSTGTTKTRYTNTHASLAFVGDTFTFHFTYSFAEGSTRRIVARTSVSGSFPRTGSAHVDVRFTDRSTRHHTTDVCTAKGAFSVRRSS